MPDRAAQIDTFLTAAGWSNAARTLVAGDASNRRYERLTDDTGATAILMDAPPDKGEDVRPFVTITTYLRAAHLSAPAIYAQDAANGFLLIEDLGDALYARVMARDPDQQTPLYEAAIDVLVHLHAQPAPDLPTYDATVMTDRARLAYDWYRLGVMGADDTTRAQAFADTFHALLSELETDNSVLIQRDYHAENLLWLPDRTGPARVGLLDYQDAMLGHPAYDLISLTQDARRDVAPPMQAAMIHRYAIATSSDPDALSNACALLGAQRNLRILGVFARLSMAYGKPHYVDLIPRVWGHITYNLSHPALAPIADQIRADLPAPTPPILQHLKDLCATHPTP
ncbi:MAG: phosphotransferase [Pseudomonadota bacterium]